MGPVWAHSSGFWPSARAHATAEVYEPSGVRCRRPCLRSAFEPRVLDVVAEVRSHVVRRGGLEDVCVHRPEGGLRLVAHARGERLNDPGLEVGARMGSKDRLALL